MPVLSSLLHKSCFSVSGSNIVLGCSIPLFPLSPTQYPCPIHCFLHFQSIVINSLLTVSTDFELQLVKLFNYISQPIPSSFFPSVLFRNIVSLVWILLLFLFVRVHIWRLCLYWLKISFEEVGSSRMLVTIYHYRAMQWASECFHSLLCYARVSIF